MIIPFLITSLENIATNDASVIVSLLPYDRHDQMKTPHHSSKNILSYISRIVAIKWKLLSMDHDSDSFDDK